MIEVKFKNDYFESVKDEKGSFIITILKDSQKFYGIDMQGCKLITNSYGVINDEFTENAMNIIKSKCSSVEEIHDLKNELRCRQLNTLMQYL